MKNKNILPYFFILILLNNLLYGDDFIIKLASYHNKEQLSKQIKLLDTEIQIRTVLIEENGLYKLFSHNFSTKEDALRLLPKYQTIFSDAYIMINRYKENIINNVGDLIQKASSLQEDNTSIHPSQEIMQPINKNLTSPQSLRTILTNKTYYLCPNKITALSEKLLIKAKFLDNNVSYHTLLGKMPDFKMSYIIKYNRLYIIRNNQISLSQFSTIDNIYFEYMVVTRWMKGKKIHQMRYYNKEQDARSYIDSINLE